MKLFQPLRKMMPLLVGYNCLTDFGFVPPSTFRKYFCLFASLLGYVVLVSATILVGCFLVFEAETFEEVSGHFYEFATGINDTFYFISMHWMCKGLFELIAKYEQIIQKRELILKKN